MRAEEQNAFRGTKALIILSIVGVSFARHADMPGWLHEVGRVTYRIFLAKGNVADFGKPCMVDDVQGDLLPKLHEVEGAQRLQRGR